MSIDSTCIFCTKKLVVHVLFFLENCDYVDDIMTSAVTPIFTK